MANDKNLIRRNLTTEEAREIGRKGGIASGEARRERRRMKECAEMILALPVKDKRKLNKLVNRGIAPEDADTITLLVAALIDKACTGDVNAAKEVRSLIGEDTRLPPGSDGEYDGLFDAIAKAVLP